MVLTKEFLESKLKREVKEYDRYFALRCYKHPDKHPSMLIYKNGFIKCYACGYTSHVKNDFAVSVETPEGYNPNETIVVKKYITYATLPETPAIEFRNISKQTLQFYDLRESLNSIWIPIWTRPFLGLNGYVVYNQNGKKYYSPTLFADQFHFSRSYYPQYQKNEKNKSIIITEGASDALALIDHGFKAVSFFGTNVLDPAKIFFLLRQSLKSKIILMFDNDTAGQRATEQLTKKLKELNVTPYVIVSTFGDPDELVNNMNALNKLKKIVTYIENGGLKYERFEI
ncbi:MAG: toprim domain-containing protein [Thermoplasmata archaeon]